MSPIRRRGLVLFSVVLFLLLSVSGEVSIVFASPKVGIVQKAIGVATVVRQGKTITAAAGLEIWENDTLRTGSNGYMGVVFNDETLLSLGPGSVLVVDKFMFVPKQGKFSIVLKMIKGTAAYVSGLIAKLAPESAYFETPTASIGIRGTKFVVKVEDEKN